MKITLGLFLALAPVLVGCVGASGQGSGKNPPGLVAGQLTKCPASPNCANTEYPSDTAHFIEPVEMQITEHTASLVQETVQAMGGRLKTKSDTYLAFTFTSLVFRFVDDFEVRLDPEAKQLHLRSASRLGHSDFGVNRRRVEKFKEELRSIIENI